jgi:CDP-diacylglycerol---serine O-phosphatidyltransferase
MTKPESRLRYHRRRAVFLLPSAFTIGNIFFGFFAVILALRERFFWAAVCILVAAIVDNLDGRIARMTGTESDFGREFDSLADVMTFGATPALVAHLWGLSIWSRVGWLVPLFFVVCCATRLARFNVQTVRADKRYFVGLPCPAAGGGIACILLAAPQAEGRMWLLVGMAVALVLLGSLMVSTFRYWSFKSLDFRRPHSYRVALPLAAMVVLLAFYPEAFLPVMASAYALSGPLIWLVNRAGFGRPAPPPPPDTVAA